MRHLVVTYDGCLDNYELTLYYVANLEGNVNKISEPRGFPKDIVSYER